MIVHQLEAGGELGLGRAAAQARGRATSRHGRTRVARVGVNPRLAGVSHVQHSSYVLVQPPTSFPCWTLLALDIDRIPLPRPPRCRTARTRAGQNSLYGALILDKLSIDQRLFSLVIVEPFLRYRGVQLSIRGVDERAPGYEAIVENVVSSTLVR